MGAVAKLCFLLVLVFLTQRIQASDELMAAVYTTSCQNSPSQTVYIDRCVQLGSYWFRFSVEPSLSNYHGLFVFDTESDCVDGTNLVHSEGVLTYVCASFPSLYYSGYYQATWLNPTRDVSLYWGYPNCDSTSSIEIEFNYAYCPTETNTMVRWRSNGTHLFEYTGNSARVDCQNDAQTWVRSQEMNLTLGACQHFDDSALSLWAYKLPIPTPTPLPPTPTPTPTPTPLPIVGVFTHSDCTSANQWDKVQLSDGMCGNIAGIMNYYIGLAYPNRVILYNSSSDCASQTNGWGSVAFPSVLDSCQSSVAVPYMGMFTQTYAMYYGGALPTPAPTATPTPTSTPVPVAAPTATPAPLGVVSLFSSSECVSTSPYGYDRQEINVGSCVNVNGNMMYYIGFSSSTSLSVYNSQSDCLAGLNGFGTSPFIQETAICQNSVAVPYMGQSTQTYLVYNGGGQALPVNPTPALVSVPTPSPTPAVQIPVSARLNAVPKAVYKAQTPFVIVPLDSSNQEVVNGDISAFSATYQINNGTVQSVAFNQLEIINGRQMRFNITPQVTSGSISAVVLLNGATVQMTTIPIVQGFNISVLGSANITGVRRSDTVKVSVGLSASDLSPYNDVSFRFTWTKLSGPPVTLSSSVLQVKDLIFFPRTLPYAATDNPFRFSLTAEPTIAPGNTLTTEVYISFAPMLSLVAIVSGASTRQIAPTVTSLTLDASVSYDPENIRPIGGFPADYVPPTLTFTWTCTEVALPSGTPTDIPCTSIPNFIKSQTFTQSTLEINPSNKTAGSYGYDFVMTFAASDGRTESASTRVVVVQNPPPQVAILRLPFPKANAGERVQLIGSVESFGPFTTQWNATVNGNRLILDSSVISGSNTSQTLVIKEGVFQVGAVYVFTLTATDTQSLRTGFASRTIEVNSPPQAGTCSPSPSTGIALTTDFTLTCSGFTDVDQPLTYLFGYVSSVGNVVPMSLASTSPVFLTKLPQGFVNNVVLPLYVDVADIYGSTLRYSFSVNVTLPVFTSTSDQVSFASARSAEVLANANDPSTLSAAVASVGEVINTALAGGNADVTTQKTRLREQLIAQVNSQLSKQNSSFADSSSVLAAAASLAVLTFEPREVSPTAQSDAASLIITALSSNILQSSDAVAVPTKPLNDVAANNVGKVVSNLLDSAVSTSDGGVVPKLGDSVNLLQTSVLKGRVAGEPPSLVSAPQLNVLAQRNVIPDGSTNSNNATYSPIDSVSIHLSDLPIPTGSPFVDSKLAVWNTNPWFYTESSKNVTGKVVSVNFATDRTGGTELQVDNLARPVRIVVARAKPRIDISLKETCKYYVPSTAQWSSTGCETVNATATEVICDCYHLTDFSFLEQFIPPINTLDASDFERLKDINADNAFVVIVIACMLGGELIIGAFAWWYDRKLRNKELTDKVSAFEVKKHSLHLTSIAEAEEAKTPELDLDLEFRRPVELEKQTVEPEKSSAPIVVYPAAQIFGQILTPRHATEKSPAEHNHASEIPSVLTIDYEYNPDDFELEPQPVDVYQEDWKDPVDPSEKKTIQPEPAPFVDIPLATAGPAAALASKDIEKGLEEPKVEKEDKLSKSKAMKLRLKFSVKRGKKKAIKDLKENHTWIQIIYGHSMNTMTRPQLLSLVFSAVLATMLGNAMFAGQDQESFNFGQSIVAGIITTMIASPPILLLTTLFSLSETFWWDSDKKRFISQSQWEAENLSVHEKLEKATSGEQKKTLGKPGMIRQDRGQGSIFAFFSYIFLLLIDIGMLIGAPFEGPETIPFSVTKAAPMHIVAPCIMGFLILVSFGLLFVKLRQTQKRIENKTVTNARAEYRDAILFAAVPLLFGMFSGGFYFNEVWGDEENPSFESTLAAYGASFAISGVVFEVIKFFGQRRESAKAIMDQQEALSEEQAPPAQEEEEEPAKKWPWWVGLIGWVITGLYQAVSGLVVIVYGLKFAQEQTQMFVVATLTGIVHEGVISEPMKGITKAYFGSFVAAMFIKAHYVQNIVEKKEGTNADTVEDNELVDKAVEQAVDALLG